VLRYLLIVQAATEVIGIERQTPICYAKRFPMFGCRNSARLGKATAIAIRNALTTPSQTPDCSERSGLAQLG
jgi:hypothetical protein